jgi:hypothetical protein
LLCQCIHRGTRRTPAGQWHREFPAA